MPMPTLAAHSPTAPLRGGRNRAPMRAWALFGAGLLLAAGNAALAEEVELQAVMVPQEQIRLDFEDGSKHFVLFVRREGRAEGVGPLDGTEVTEYGMHDIVPVRAVTPSAICNSKLRMDHWPMCGGASGQFSCRVRTATLSCSTMESGRSWTVRGNLAG